MVGCSTASLTSAPGHAVLLPEHEQHGELAGVHAMLSNPTVERGGEQAGEVIDDVSRRLQPIECHGG
jgi:hypothetical protein